MGQAASTTAAQDDDKEDEDVFSPKANDDNKEKKKPRRRMLHELTDDELLRLWKESPLSADEIRAAARQREVSSSSSDHSRLYYQVNNHNFKMDDETEDNNHRPTEERRDDPTTALAHQLLRVLRDLSAIRFRLVPSRLKEHLFWEVTFELLEDRLSQHDEEEDNGPRRLTRKGQRNTSSKTDDELREILAQKNEKIDLLTRRVQELQLALENEREKKKKQKQSTSCASPATSAACCQGGKWVLSRESQEFLAYPDEIKENLRREKRKRLQAVRDEMKFILDSDLPQDAQGHWDCCGNTNYDKTHEGNGCKR